jgi:YD repeat-containing protein
MRYLILAASFVAIISSGAVASTATTYTYDTLGRVSTATYPNGTVITYSYDPAGNRTQVVTVTSP